MTAAVLSVDIGTSSSKGVLVDGHGSVLASATREHVVSRPAPGHVEMDPVTWWDEFASLARELTEQAASLAAHVTAVGVSGMGPCVLLTDDDDEPLRPAILYGVDTRATRQVRALTDRYGDQAIRERCGSSLSSQAAGAKVVWVAEEEPEVFARARRQYMPASWLVRQLTGSYVLDHHSASQCTPLYDLHAGDWYRPWVADLCPDLDLPPLRWAGEVAGHLTRDAAAVTGLPEGVPVITGTIDAWAEAIGADAHRVGDLMLMYGTTMFLIHTVADVVTSPSLWGTQGALSGTHSLAGGMSTSGALTGWLRDLFGGPGYGDLVRQAEKSPPGSNGLLMLPYFAGERTPILDPDARGVLAGLTLSHDQGDLYRAALEAVGFGVRHNVETFQAAGGDVRRVVAVGGGTQGRLWTQVVSDITGLTQVVPAVTAGAPYGGALLAARAVGEASATGWNPIAEIVEPDPATRSTYDALHDLYRELYQSTRKVTHALAALQRTQTPWTRSDA